MATTWKFCEIKSKVRQAQRFRLVYATCNYAICDPAQRRESEILKSHYSLETACFEDSPAEGPATQQATDNESPGRPALGSRM